MTDIKMQKAAAWLSLIAYTDESLDDSHPLQQYTDIKNNLSTFVPDEANGPYNLVWGPATKDGLLLYVAQGKDQSYAIACRGTIGFELDDIVDWLLNVLDDLDALILDDWQYPVVQSNPSAKVTDGTLGALTSCLAAQDRNTGETLLTFLTKCLGDSSKTDPTKPLMVAGHSLGAGLANVLGVYLADQLPAAVRRNITGVVPMTFAAPTVTNSTFAKLVFPTYCPTSYQCVNTQDIVPKAWNNLTGVIHAYSVPSDSFPPLFWYSPALWSAAEVAQEWISGRAYDFEPVSVQEDTFDGALVVNVNWGAQAGAQHKLVGPYFSHLGLSLPKTPMPGLPLDPLSATTTTTTTKPPLAVDMVLKHEKMAVKVNVTHVEVDTADNV